MDQEKFIAKAKELIAKDYHITHDELKVTWLVYAAGNNKALLAGPYEFYFEATYIKRDNVIAIDRYNMVDHGEYHLREV